MSKTCGVTIHRVFHVYQNIFDYFGMQISKSERKQMQWKVDIGESLVKAKLKAPSYYGKMKSPRGLLFSIGTFLNPYCKLTLLQEWDLDASGDTEYEMSYKKEFIVYYDLYNPPINNQAADVSIPRSGLNCQSKYLYSARHKAIILSKALPDLETDSEIEPLEPDAALMNPTWEACLAEIFYKANILDCSKVNAGRFCNLAWVARDILAGQVSSVGVQRVFSMAREVIRYQRSRLKSSTIRSSMPVKS